MPILRKQHMLNKLRDIVTRLKIGETKDSVVDQAATELPAVIGATLTTDPSRLKHRVLTIWMNSDILHPWQRQNLQDWDSKLMAQLNIDANTVSCA